MTRDSILFGIQAFVDPRKQEVIEEKDFLEVEESAIFSSVLPAVRQMGKQTHYLEVVKQLKELLQTGVYDKAERLRHREEFLPTTREKLEKDLRYREWPKQIIARSQVKNKTRVLYRSKNLSIAETHESQEGNLNSKVRETEVILKRPDGTGWDFYVYDSLGKRTAKSVFATKAGKEFEAYSPYTCMTCHYDGANRQFQRYPLSFARRTMLE